LDSRSNLSSTIEGSTFDTSASLKKGQMDRNEGGRTFLGEVTKSILKKVPQQQRKLKKGMRKSRGRGGKKILKA